jgi:hypothetical protein
MRAGRIPVYRQFPDRIEWLLMTKDLLLINAAERHVLAVAAKRFPALLRPIQRVPHSLPLLDLLHRFSQGSVRLALVVDNTGILLFLSLPQPPVPFLFFSLCRHSPPAPRPAPPPPPLCSRGAS